MNAKPSPPVRLISIRNFQVRSQTWHFYEREGREGRLGLLAVVRLSEEISKTLPLSPSKISPLDKLKFSENVKFKTKQQQRLHYRQDNTFQSWPKLSVYTGAYIGVTYYIVVYSAVSVYFNSAEWEDIEVQSDSCPVMFISRTVCWIISNCPHCQCQSSVQDKRQQFQ